MLNDLTRHVRVTASGLGRWLLNFGETPPAPAPKPPNHRKDEQPPDPLRNENGWRVGYYNTPSFLSRLEAGLTSLADHLIGGIDRVEGFTPTSHDSMDLLMRRIDARLQAATQAFEAARSLYEGQGAPPAFIKSTVPSHRKTFDISDGSVWMSRGSRKIYRLIQKDEEQRLYPVFGDEPFVSADKFDKEEFQFLGFPTPMPMMETGSLWLCVGVTESNPYRIHRLEVGTVYGVGAMLAMEDREGRTAARLLTLRDATGKKNHGIEILDEEISDGALFTYLGMGAGRMHDLLRDVAAPAPASPPAADSSAPKRGPEGLRSDEGARPAPMPEEDGRGADEPSEAQMAPGSAETSPRPGAPHSFIPHPLRFLEETGLLAEINRLALHPLGIQMVTNGTELGLLDNRKDPEGYALDEKALEESQRRLADYLAQHGAVQQSRRARLGYVVQPVPHLQDPELVLSSADIEARIGPRAVAILAQILCGRTALDPNAREYLRVLGVETLAIVTRFMSPDGSELFHNGRLIHHQAALDIAVSLLVQRHGNRLGFATAIGDEKGGLELWSGALQRLSAL